ncbi:MAG: hypothetical protein A3D95_14225 [Betaproteobacteria bacterium RIFCSPHIGHO2_12_FULL_69_13]|nr:MAG: hypothetical protein A3D95_14225 [Betaproteobacteria bacterium RIFCSPHIGHO2_12_FULL_69_13]OGA66556.1 MAG: hypothetical protein A3G83_09380 [Betaproteobacteria bacterium RIFCSPLOWO2_12_FULL_68_20]
MMKEIFGVADDPPARRRWFHDDYFDLFVWQAEGEITLFQLCYGLHTSERALVWDRRRGFFHDGLASGAPHEVLADRLAADAPPSADPVIARFQDAARGLPDDIRLMVSTRVFEYAKKGPATTARRRTFRRAAWQL